MIKPDFAEAESLAALLREARRAVVFTGAGISTESGIPDFRSPGGIWTKMAPIEFQDFVASTDLRREAWRRRFAMEEMFASVEPNAGHRAVARLVADGRATHVITQNIDNLHQQSGVPELQVIELHGNTRYAKCLDCGTRLELEPIRTHFEAHGDAPDCVDCGGLVKTATISFGQAMPELEMARAEEATLGLRPVHRPGLVAGGLSGGRLPGSGPAQRGQTCHRQPRPDRSRRGGPSRAPQPDRPHS